MMKEEIKNWLKQAKRDLKTSENSLKSGDYYASVFWCQQSIEKGLKALLIKELKKLVKIHDLVILGRMANLPELLLNKLKLLSSSYIESRYGILDTEIPAEKFKEEDALESIKIAGELIGWIKKKI